MADTALQKMEILIAHQEQQINDLSDMLIEQGKELDRLKMRMEQLYAKLARVESALPDDRGGLSVAEQAALDKPPHY